MRTKKITLLIITTVAFLITTANYGVACFDTCLFLNKQSMVYPTKHLVVDTLGEYSFNKMTEPNDDSFLMDFNAYYGVTKRFSLQIGASSSEKSRAQFKLDEYGIKGVYNILSEGKKMYYLDTILACRSSIDGTLSFEISAPNILYHKNNIFVLHPVSEIVKGKSVNEYSIGGHIGIFHSFNNMAIIGVGAEYRSAQNGSTFNKRLVEGESAASLFLGAKLGDVVYFQNEFAKGLANSRDLGFAATLKFFVK